MNLIEFFTGDHRDCDQGWAEVERLLDSGDAAAALEAWSRYAQAMEHHFRMEEQVLFPAFEETTGMTGGPTAVMRAEHTQMRGLLAQMDAVAKDDPETLLDQGDTLLMLVQQHNMKEEGMLYPMCQAHLGDRWGELEPRCREA